MPDCTNFMPPHILDHILGFLKPSDSALATRFTQNWKRDLLACSHVSKSWHRLALQHLFANYALRFEGCDPTLEFDIQLGTYSPTSRNLRRFERFIKDSPASFAAVMKHLSLTMARTMEDYNTYLDPTALRLMRLLNALPSLSSLRLGDVCLNSVFETTPALFEYLPSVALDRLYISYSHRPVRPSQLLHLLGCFGVVSELHLEDFELDVLSCDEITTDPSSLRVSSLFIWNMKNIRDLTHHLGSGTWADCLESLYVAGIYSDGARMLSWLVYHWASLRYLTLNMDAMYSELERSAPGLINLAPCPRLDTLSFQMSLEEGFYLSNDVRNNRVIRQITFALKSVCASPPGLVELDFYVGRRLPSAFSFPKRRHTRPLPAVRKSVRFADEDKENQAPRTLDDPVTVIKGILKRKREGQEHESRPKRICGEERSDKEESGATVHVTEDSMDTRQDQDDDDRGEEKPDKGKGRATDEDAMDTRGDQQDGHEENGIGDMGDDHTPAPEDPDAAPMAPKPSSIPASPAAPFTASPLQALAGAILCLSKNGLPDLRITLYTPPEHLKAALLDRRFLLHTLRDVLDEWRTKVECKCVVVDD